MSCWYVERLFTQGNSRSGRDILLLGEGAADFGANGSRGRGQSIATISLIRPGRAVSTTTRSHMTFLPLSHSLSGGNFCAKGG
jgi:hypothetical protein